MGTLLLHRAGKGTIAAAGGSYTGPGDVVGSALGWWGMRAYSSASAGGNAVRLIRASDSSQSDFATNSSGVLANVDSFLGGTTGKVVTWYDQSGNARDTTQGTDANRPAVAKDVDGIIPATNWNGTAFGTQPSLVSSGGPTQANPYTVVALTMCTDGTIFGRLFSTAAGGSFVGSGGTNQAEIAESGGLLVAASDNAWHVLVFVVNGASSAIYVDGTKTTGDSGPAASGLSGNIEIGGNQTFNYIGQTLEIGVWAGAFSDTQAANMRTNIQNYYGVV